MLINQIIIIKILLIILQFLNINNKNLIFLEKTQIFFYFLFTEVIFNKK